MTAGVTSNFKRLKAAVWAFVALELAFFAVSVGYWVSSIMLAGAFERFGWGNVPDAQMRPFRIALKAYEAMTPVYNIGFIALSFWVVFEAARALKFVGVKPRYAPWFASLSQVIPLALFYFPWAALGDTRKTLQHIAMVGAPPAKPISGFDGRTIVLGIVAFVRLVANRLFEAAVATPTTPKDEAAGLALMRNIETTLVGETAFGLIYLAVFVWFYLGVLRLYRRALAGAAMSDASRVFDSPLEPSLTGSTVT